MYFFIRAVFVIYPVEIIYLDVGIFFIITGQIQIAFGLRYCPRGYRENGFLIFLVFYMGKLRFLSIFATEICCFSNLLR